MSPGAFLEPVFRFISAVLACTFGLICIGTLFTGVTNGLQLLGAFSAAPAAIAFFVGALGPRVYGAAGTQVIIAVAGPIVFIPFVADSSMVRSPSLVGFLFFTFAAQFGVTLWLVRRRRSLVLCAIILNVLLAAWYFSRVSN